MIWTNCAKSTISTEPARITNHHESGNVPPTDLESGFLSLSMQNSPIGRIASLMWLRPLSRLAVVQNMQGALRSTISALQVASEHERTQKKDKPSTSSLLSDICSHCSKMMIIHDHHYHQLSCHRNLLGSKP